MKRVLLMPALLFCLSASARSLDCAYTRVLKGGTKETGQLAGKGSYEISGENESEKVRLRRGSSGHIELEVESVVDGKTFTQDLAACDRFLDCTGARKKYPRGKLKESKFSAVPSSTQAKLQLGERLMFTFQRVDPGFVFSYLNYPLPGKDGFVGVEFRCTGY
jgi:hypothetical protein